MAPHQDSSLDHTLASRFDRSARPRTPAPSRTLLPAALVFASLAGLFTLMWAPAQAQTDAGAAPLLPDTPYDYDVAIPPELTAIDNTPADNPVTDEGATLGRVLFYDLSLSANGTISCASCHDPAAGFSDPNRLSIGFAGEETRRHSMSLANARFFEPGTFFWDTRADTLEAQVLQPFVDPVEMGLTMEQLVEIVEGQSYYDSLFVDAFGTDEVTPDRISRALAQFVRSIVSLDARYDVGRAQVARAQDPFPNFTDAENRGKSLFFDGPGSCAGCHATDVQINHDRGPMNNGLDRSSSDDLGAFEVTGRIEDTGTFKVPSLRNIGETAPYMHDGRFATLEEVVEHYSSGVQNHPQLDQRLRGRGDNPINRNFSAAQASDLVAFLRTLSDQTTLTADRFSDPFVAAGRSCANAGVDDGQLSAQMVRLYTAFFGRAPDADGLGYWMGQRASGQSIGAVATAFAASDEFVATYGTLDDEAYVALVYRNVLGRTPDAEGATFWEGALLGGATRGDVMTAFSESPENVRLTGGDPIRTAGDSSIVRLYAAIFQRAPDPDGLAFWSAQLAAGATLAEVADAMVIAPEFVERYGTLPDNLFVTQVYCNVLGRDADAAGAAFWLGALDRGATRGAMMTGFSESAEFVLATDSLPPQ